MQFKRIVILANSRKHAGRCMAGRELDDNGNYLGWVRPISDRDGEEVSERERYYMDGTDPQVLDVVDVPLIKPKPHACQTENWLLSTEHYWEKADSLSWMQARALAENPAVLWTHGDSTYHGMNDQIEHARAGHFVNSICLIHIQSVDIHVFVPGANFQDFKRKVQARFVFNGANYRIWVTDPKIEKQYLAGADGISHLGECLMTVSLAEPHKKNDGSVYQYLLAAAIIPR
nr:hypothetical protein [uncultured Rhodoferax sp.]